MADCAHPVHLLSTLLVDDTCCTAEYTCGRCGQRLNVESWNLTLLTPEQARETVSRLCARALHDTDARPLALPFDEELPACDKTP